MSFLIAVYVNEGIVLASDRRTTYTNAQMIENKIIERIGIHATNSTNKTFMCPNGAGISTCGAASLLGKPITGFIQEMIRTRISAETNIDDMPNVLVNYFRSLPEVPDTNFIIAGYQRTIEGIKTQKIYRGNVLTGRFQSVDTTSQGAIWDGETSTLTRLMQNVAVKSNEGIYIDLTYEEVLWGYFTLQDAVDFARYAVETTIQTMRFKNVIETVGGSVDILVITPDETKWLQKEELL